MLMKVQLHLILVCFLIKKSTEEQKPRLMIQLKYVILHVRLKVCNSTC